MRALLAFKTASDIVSVSAVTAPPPPLLSYSVAPNASSCGIDTAKSKTDCMPVRFSYLLNGVLLPANLLAANH